MTLEELVQLALPNGFEEATLHRIERDYERDAALLDVTVWVGDRNNTEEELLFRRMRLTLTNVHGFYVGGGNGDFMYQDAEGFGYGDLPRDQKWMVQAGKFLKKEYPESFFGNGVRVQSIFFANPEVLVHFAALNVEYGWLSETE